MAAEVVSLVVNVPGAGALARAERLGIPAAVVDHRQFPDRASFENAVADVLDARGVEWVCLAGFMRLVSRTLLERFPNRVLNIHPSLLPAFPGLHAVRQALAYGVKVTGCTVHLVDSGTDTGPIVIQAAVPVLEGDDEDRLAARIHSQEHRIYPEAVRLAASGLLRMEGRRVEAPTPGSLPTLCCPPLPDGR
jgi:phosphoribosylglycinamide formyltransferase-1